MTVHADSTIRTRPCPDCYICGTKGQLLYQDLRDHLFGAPGKWNLKKCPSPECGLVWLDPMPLEEDMGKAYRTYFTHGPKERGKSFLRSPQRSGLTKLVPVQRVFKFLKHGYLASAYGYTEGISGLQRLAGYGLYLYPFLVRSLAKGIRDVHYLPHGCLLDVGCGNGTYLHYMRGLRWEVEGTEVDPSAIAQTQRYGLLVHKGTLEQQGFEDNRFDEIIVSHVLEHVHDPFGLLKECQRLLKPGRTLRVFVPNVESAGHRRFRENWRGLEPPRHIHIFTTHALKKLAVKAGFDVNVKTSAEGARGSYIKSTALTTMHCRERYVASLSSLSLKAYFFGVYESLVVLMGREQGEEIVLRATKP